MAQGMSVTVIFEAHESKCDGASRSSGYGACCPIFASVRLGQIMPAKRRIAVAFNNGVQEHPDPTQTELGCGGDPAADSEQTGIGRALRLQAWSLQKVGNFKALEEAVQDELTRCQLLRINAELEKREASEIAEIGAAKRVEVAQLEHLLADADRDDRCFACAARATKMQMIWASLCGIVRSLHMLRYPSVNNAELLGLVTDALAHSASMFPEIASVRRDLAKGQMEAARKERLQREMELEAVSRGVSLHDLRRVLQETPTRKVPVMPDDARAEPPARDKPSLEDELPGEIEDELLSVRDEILPGDTEEDLLSVRGVETDHDHEESTGWDDNIIAVEQFSRRRSTLSEEGDNDVEAYLEAL
eukprot:TRINITY_DN32251_c0_g1_i1.p1 TRINITY_DN32251_c0_g1~~TRINITY_DN32251_c0_g1_i1.p1  ORF type:complete len:361 (-),score=62.92 TRINITY_DN32251_c0_g1_i1:492-1574(-)